MAACIAAGCGGYDDSNLDPDTAGPNGFADGIVELEYTQFYEASDVIALPDGRLVLAGTPGNTLAAMRLLENGLADPAFGEGGVARVVLSAPYASHVVRRTPDGKLLLLGARGSPRVSIIVRLVEDGTLDHAFGAGGYLQIPTALVQAITVLPDGRFYVMGRWYETGQPMLWIARYAADGVLDTSFGMNGTVFETGMSEPYDLVALADGRIAVVEEFGNGIVRTLRLNSDGSRDTTFGDAAFGTIVVGEPFWVTGLGALADHRLIIGGYTTHPSTGFDLAVIRTTADGHVDPSFGGTGIARVDVEIMDVGLGSVVEPDDSVVLCGATYLSGQDAIDRPADAILARIRPDGTPDPAFGTNGIARASHNANALTGKVIAQRDGKLVAMILNGRRLVRFTANGALDTR